MAQVVDLRQQVGRGITPVETGRQRFIIGIGDIVVGEIAVNTKTDRVGLHVLVHGLGIDAER